MKARLRQEVKGLVCKKVVCNKIEMVRRQGREEVSTSQGQQMPQDEIVKALGNQGKVGGYWEWGGC